MTQSDVWRYTAYPTSNSHQRRLLAVRLPCARRAVATPDLRQTSHIGAFAVRLGQFLHGGIRWLREALLFAPCFPHAPLPGRLRKTKRNTLRISSEKVSGSCSPISIFIHSPRKQLVRHEENC